MFEYGFRGSRTNISVIEGIASEFADEGWDYGEDAPRRSNEQFQKVMNDLEGATIHVAWYGTGNYEGKAFVLYEKGGKLYENYGSHCSCYGLEGQWSPEETTWEALKLRVDDRDYSIPRTSDDDYDYGQSGESDAAVALKAAIEAHNLTIN